MVPSLEWAKALCEISEMEERLLCSAEAPIVLLRRRAKVGSPPATAGNDVRSSSPSASVGDPSAVIAEAAAPRNPYLGLMLPYTPLHHLLLKAFPFPLVATSGNMSEEPICI